MRKERGSVIVPIMVSGFAIDHDVNKWGCGGWSQQQPLPHEQLRLL